MLQVLLGPGRQVLLLLELELAVVVVPVVVLGRHVVQPLDVQEPGDGVEQCSWRSRRIDVFLMVSEDESVPDGL